MTQIYNTLKSVGQIVLLGGVFGLGIGITAKLYQTQNKSVTAPAKNKIQEETKQKAPEKPKEDKDKKMRGMLLSYLSQPQFSGPKFMRQVTGTRAELQIYDIDEEKLYFSLPERFYDAKTLDTLSKNKDRIEFATKDGKFTADQLKLGDLILTKPGNYFFRFPADDFKVNRNNRIRNKLGNYEYTQTLQELSDFIENKSIYGGSVLAVVSKNRDGVRNVIANHGAYVAKKEKSLGRLVNSILGKDKLPNEEISQRLLDFVTNDIKYLESDADTEVEVLKRANEVLMTGGSDCTGKVILYASLLEQTKVNYRLAYFPEHISVAVEGNYLDENGYSFNIGNNKFSIAETTTKGFVIGRSTLNVPLTLERMDYFQKPGIDSKIYRKNGKALEFE